MPIRQLRPIGRYLAIRRDPPSMIAAKTSAPKITSNVWDRWTVRTMSPITSPHTSAFDAS